VRVSVCAAIHFPVSLRLLSDCCLNIEHARMSDVPFPGPLTKSTQEFLTCSAVVSVVV